MRRRAKWWWNGRWGRIARRDIKIYTDDTQWWLEDVRGGVEGTVHSVDNLDETAAVKLATRMMDGSDGWQDMMAER